MVGVAVLLKTLVAKLLGAGSRLSDLEKLVLDAVRSRLDQQHAPNWDRQVQAINKVQRLPEGCEVNFYRMAKGRPTFDDALAFPNKTTELHLADVKVSWGNVSSELVAHVWCVRGFLLGTQNIDGSPCKRSLVTNRSQVWMRKSPDLTFCREARSLNAFWHAMRDGTANQSVGAASKLFEQYIEDSIKSCTQAGLARALHAAQDSAAAGQGTSNSGPVAYPTQNTCEATSSHLSDH